MVYAGLAVPKLLPSLRDCVSDPLSEFRPWPFIRRDEGTSSLAISPGRSSLPCSTRRLTICIASRNVSPLSSMAARNRANSLHRSQSSSRMARENRRTDCSDAVANSSNVCNMSRYPPAVFSEPRCSDSSKSSPGGGRYAKSVRHDLTSVFRVH